MGTYPHKLLVITATLSSIKSSYAFSNCNPNHIMQALIAILAGWAVAFVCTETHQLGGRDYRFLLVPGSSLPLAGVERPWEIFGRPGLVVTKHFLFSRDAISAHHNR
jgi:hypothetical protein